MAASLVRAGLSLVEPLHASVSGLRNWGYDQGWLRSERLAVPVISIGNLTAGGTGKTPTVAWVVKTLQSLGRRPAMISRGYGAGDADGNDEKKLLDRLLPSVPHHQSPDRIAAAAALLTEQSATPPNVLVLDDAFQHRRIVRDFDLVLIDCLNPFGYGHQLPRGTLRESLAGLRRASAILLTRSDQIDAEGLVAIRTEVARHSSAPLFISHFEPTGLIDSRGEVTPLDAWHHREVAAFCAIGNPAGFQRTLVSCGYALPEARFQTFPDHHIYTPAELKTLAGKARHQGAECLLTTAKDLVKIPTATIQGMPVRAVEIVLRLDHEADEVALVERLRGALSPM